MQPKQPRSKRTRILVLALSIFALLALIASFGGCNREPTNRPTPQTQASPTSSPVPEATQGTEGDTPIVVKGGGSIDLDFDENAYTGSGNICVGCKITSVTLQQLPPPGQPSTSLPTQCPFTGSDRKIKIETAGNNDITVEQNTLGVEIGFDKSKYPAVVNACGDEKKHHSHPGVIQHVKLNGTECTVCSTPQRCKVVIHVF